MKTGFAKILGTWFGCGLSPVAPGTVGTIGALPLFWLISSLSTTMYWLVVVAISVIGIWASQGVADALGEKDPSQVVIDEVAGVLIALGCVRSGTLPALLVAVVAFRVFDIWKPGPVRKAERAKPEGLGIMLDDLVAGAIAGLVTWAAFELSSYA